MGYQKYKLQVLNCQIMKEDCGKNILNTSTWITKIQFSNIYFDL